MSATYRFTLNGKAVEVLGSPMARLLDVLRRDLGLTGAKEGCGEGECGACTVLLDDAAVCSCLVPLFQVEGTTVTTIEGLAPVETGALSTDMLVSDLQRVFALEGGAQCGACTPGMVLTIKALLARYPKPSRDQVREYVSGTLCRCTGYERIFRAIEVLTAQRLGEGSDGVVEKGTGRP